jgi:ribosomal protein S3AE
MTASELTTDRLNILRGWWPKTWYSIVSNNVLASRKDTKTPRKDKKLYISLRLGGFA